MHVALLLVRVGLRVAELAEEVAEQLEAHAADMGPTVLTGALVALSQLGPWGTVSPGGALADALVEFLDALSLNELSAAALAAATLGVEELRFWQLLHGELLSRMELMQPRHLADATLALATTQLCPIVLLDALEGRVRAQAGAFDVEDAITTAWALCALRFFRPLPGLLAHVSEEAVSFLAVEQQRQLRQVALSLELESSAAAAKVALNPGVLAELGDAAGQGDEAAHNTEILEEIREALVEAGGSSEALFAGEVVADGFYALDITLCPQPGCPGAAVLLDVGGGEVSNGPRDPWLQLKLRHLKLLGWRVAWLPVRCWRAWDAEERRAFAEQLVQQPGSETGGQ